MPIASPIDIAVLSSPIPMPGETGTIAPSSFGTSTQQNIQAMTRGSGVTSPIGTGNTMTPMSFSPVGIPGQLEGTITGAALESGGANVGGVVQQAPKEDLETKLEFASLEDQKIAGQEKAQQEQADEFMKAYEEGAKISVKGKFGSELSINWENEEVGYHVTITDDGGDVIIYNDEIMVKEGSQGKGLGTKLFTRQINNAVKAGIKRIECLAAKEEDMNGFYTWPRMGFDAKLIDIDITIPDQFKSAKTVLDLFSMDCGS